MDMFITFKLCFVLCGSNLRFSSKYIFLLCSQLEKRSINLNKISRKDHLSPGSVLEASFSSSSLDDSSGRLLKFIGFKM